MKDVYDRIETVLKEHGKPVAAHEFAEFGITPPPTRGFVNARQYVGCTEATIGRRLRELKNLGRVTAKKRDGKQYVEYALAKKAPVQADFPAEAVAA